MNNKNKVIFTNTNLLHRIFKVFDSLVGFVTIKFSMENAIVEVITNENDAFVQLRMAACDFVEYTISTPCDFSIDAKKLADATKSIFDENMSTLTFDSQVMVIEQRHGNYIASFEFVNKCTDFSPQMEIPNSKSVAVFKLDTTYLDKFISTIGSFCDECSFIFTSDKLQVLNEDNASIEMPCACDHCIGDELKVNFTVKSLAIAQKFFKMFRACTFHFVVDTAPYFHFGDEMNGDVVVFIAPNKKT